jgi:hypothetical protein
MSRNFPIAAATVVLLALLTRWCESVEQDRAGGKPSAKDQRAIQR